MTKEGSCIVSKNTEPAWGIVAISRMVSSGEGTGHWQVKQGGVNNLAYLHCYGLILPCTQCDGYRLSE